MIDNRSNLFSISSGGGFVFSADLARPGSKKKKITTNILTVIITWNVGKRDDEAK